MQEPFSMNTPSFTPFRYKSHFPFSFGYSFSFLHSEFSATLKVYTSDSWFSPGFRNYLFVFFSYLFLENISVFSRYMKFSLFLMCGNWLVHSFFFLFRLSQSLFLVGEIHKTYFHSGFFFRVCVQLSFSFLRFCIHTTGKM